MRRVCPRDQAFHAGELVVAFMLRARMRTYRSLDILCVRRQRPLSNRQSTVEATVELYLSVPRGYNRAWRQLPRGNRDSSKRIIDRNKLKEKVTRIDVKGGESEMRAFVFSLRDNVSKDLRYISLMDALRKHDDDEIDEEAIPTPENTANTQLYMI